MSEVWYTVYDKNGFINCKSTQLERAYSMAQEYTLYKEEVLFVFSEEEYSKKRWVVGNDNYERRLLALVFQSAVFKREETSEGEKK